MSDYDDYFYGPEDYGPDPIPERDMEDILFGQNYDAHAQELMMEAVTSGEDSRAWSELGDYMWEEYGIDMEAEWDWIEFREWYDGS